MADLIRCPFCGEDDFDRIGLKLHLQRGWCDAFNETPTTDRPEPVKPLADGVKTCRAIEDCPHPQDCGKAGGCERNDAARGVPACPALPTTDELENLWQTTHYGHPADFAADVLERWGGWMPGLLGHGGALQEAVKIQAQRNAGVPGTSNDQQGGKDA